MFDARSASMARWEERAAVGRGRVILYGDSCVVYEVGHAPQKLPYGVAWHRSWFRLVCISVGRRSTGQWFSLRTHILCPLVRFARLM